jgi:23S rRNA pseudouridine1911/1915/1917 synthase
MDDISKIEHEVSPEQARTRLDQVVATVCPQYSRSQLQKWIKTGDIILNGEVATAKTKVAIGDVITISPVQQEQVEFEPENIPLDIIYEDDSILVVNKPANLVVHPAAGNWSGTLVNALLHHDEKLKHLPRAGIVHRLDKNTTGLMVVAKTLEAHQSLVNQLQERTVKREYLALVHGKVIAGGTIEGNIGRHPIDRKKMAVVDGGKSAITHYLVEERLPHNTLLRVRLETGRTHQIRVHLSWKKMPIMGDQAYGGRYRIPAGLSESAKHYLQSFNRQALHATQLGLIHPATAEYCQWSIPMPDDMQTLIKVLGDNNDD